MPSVSAGEHVLVHGVSLSEDRIRLANASTGLLKFVTLGDGTEAVVDGKARWLSSFEPDEGVVYANEERDRWPGEDPPADWMEPPIDGEAWVALVTPAQVLDVVIDAVEAAAEVDGGGTVMNGYVP